MKIHPYLIAVLAGLAAALTVAIPLVDDGLLPSEALSILLAFITGTGLKAAPGVVKPPKHRAD